MPRADLQFARILLPLGSQSTEVKGIHQHTQLMVLVLQRVSPCLFQSNIKTFYYVFMYVTEDVRGLRCPEAGVTSGGEPSDMGAGQ